jgi:PiT family inorganic phosphate transporter
MSLLISPLMGFVLAAVLLLVLKQIVKSPALYQEPKGKEPPPLWIRGLLILTCTLVSFFHGSNDGQKGMGLIMLILVGTAPTAYALNRGIPAYEVAAFVEATGKAQAAVVAAANNALAPAEPLKTVETYLQTRDLKPDTLPALGALIGDIGAKSKQFGSPAGVPEGEISAVRSEMYIASEALRVLKKSGDLKLDEAGSNSIKAFKAGIDNATRYIPTWVKVAIAIALGLGTMVGWKRIVVTVGEKIGKTHLTYAQGASAELVAAGMIGVADGLGLPVSTTHVLSSGVAGTMAANGSGLQMSTLRSLAIAWVLTLPASIMLAGTLYYLFSLIA